MSDTSTAETQAAEDDAFVVETLRRFEQQWLPAQMQDNNALALANAWRDCDNMLSRLTRGDPITSDYSEVRLGIRRQQDRLKDWARRLGFPHMLDPDDHVRRTTYATFQKAQETGPGAPSRASVDEFENQQRDEMARKG
ncbi:hypothetical protein CDV31_014762 [Fusarium ambrosium]|uniref:Uncharacterized protein n=1 Tax=Fusarium ambrosium TaxID=131363 RepID=A0A428SUD8_9HYPO|nr:hypothetical protein CDV31_014762 [Fusarium ambrosium]